MRYCVTAIVFWSPSNPLLPTSTCYFLGATKVFFSTLDFKSPKPIAVTVIVYLFPETNFKGVDGLVVSMTTDLPVCGLITIVYLSTVEVGFHLARITVAEVLATTNVLGFVGGVATM